MRNGLRYSNFLLVSAVLLCLGAVSSAQQITFYPDFSGPTDPYHFLQLNANQSNPIGVPGLAQWNNMTVLRLTDGATPPSPEASTAYFQQVPISLGVGEQPVNVGFTTWFQFQAHNLQCCSPGDGFAFIVQFATSTDSSYGARGSYSGALGAGNGDIGGGLGYAGINNSLAIEFDPRKTPGTRTETTSLFRPAAQAQTRLYTITGTIRLGITRTCRTVSIRRIRSLTRLRWLWAARAAERAVLTGLCTTW